MKSTLNVIAEDISFFPTDSLEPIFSEINSYGLNYVAWNDRLEANLHACK
jgi:hypothetical protein